MGFWIPAFAGMTKGGRNDGCLVKEPMLATRFFVAGPPQNDMWERRRGRRRGEEDREPPRRGGFLLSQE